MFGIGFWELAIIVLLTLLVVGPERIGPLARAIGRAMREMRRGMDEFRETFKIDEPVREIEALRSEIVRDVAGQVQPHERAEVVDGDAPPSEQTIVKASGPRARPEQVTIDCEPDPGQEPVKDSGQGQEHRS